MSELKSPFHHVEFEGGFGVTTTPTNQYKLTTEQKVERLHACIALLATEFDRLTDRLYEAGLLPPTEQYPPEMSVEEKVERTLVPEHFTWTAVPKGGVWHS